MKRSLLTITSIFLLATSTAIAPIALAANTPNQSPTISKPEKLYQAGQNAFTQGKFAEAVSQWQAAVVICQQQGDRLRESVILANLALAHRELGQWKEATTTVTKSLELARSLEAIRDDKFQIDVQKAIAQALDTKGSLEFTRGQIQAALHSWQEAQPIHQKLNDQIALIRNEINQSRAYQRLGLFLQATQILELTNQSILQQPDSLLKVDLLHHVGNIFLSLNDPTNATPYLKQSLDLLAKLGDSPATSTKKSGILLDLGHLSRTQLTDNPVENNPVTDNQVLLTTHDLYTQAIATAFYPLDRVNAQLSLAELLLTSKKLKELALLLTQIEPNIALLPLSRNGLENRIRYAEILGKVSKREAAALLLAKAIAQAKDIGDNRTYIYALGALGHLYEQSKQFDDAIQVTRQAIALAEVNNAEDLTYQLHWQLAKVLVATGKNEAALISYGQAVEVLKPIQGDLASAAANAQFSFQDSIEPLYREYVSLLLDTSGSDNPNLKSTHPPHNHKSNHKNNQPLNQPLNQQYNQQKLRQAQSVIESLKVAELVNFFRSDCLKTQSNDITQIDSSAAVVYVITLNNSLEVLLNLPDGNIKLYTIPITSSEVESTVVEFRRNLRYPITQEYLEQSQKIYDWTIRPLEEDLIRNNVKTLVIVSDQALRNMPFAALHDGKQFLIEKYALAASPGLQLLDSKPIAKKQINALLVGLTQSRFSFSALPAVQQELESIQKQVGKASSNLLLNETFTSQNLQRSIQSLSFPVVHIATHGQFSSNATETYIVAWDQKVNIESLNGILRSRERSDADPLELLILSACQTANGDKRSALGLAGIAVRAGARSTIGSLWQISDEATSILMSELYKQLTDRNLSRAESLRSAQLTLLKEGKFKHPYYWSAFILLGNWQ
jgi:CHAT domain-containing protein